MRFNSKYRHTQNKKTPFKNKAWRNPCLKINQLKEFIIKILIKINENFSFLNLFKTNFTPTKKSSDFIPEHRFKKMIKINNYIKEC